MLTADTTRAYSNTSYNMSKLWTFQPQSSGYVQAQGEETDERAKL